MNLTTPTRTLRSAVRRSRALLGAAAVLMAIGAAGCTAAPATPSAAPADPSPVTAVSGQGGSAVLSAPTTKSGPAATATRGAEARSVAAATASWPVLRWYSAQQYHPNAPARIWQRTAAGRRQVVREGTPGEKGRLSAVTPSPDGRRAAWLAYKPNRLVIDRFEGGARRTLPLTAGVFACNPTWVSNSRVLYTVGPERDWTYVTVNADGTGRRVLATHQKTCAEAGAGLIATYGARTVSLMDQQGHERTVKPRIPANLRIHGLPGISVKSIVVSAQTPTAGGCSCSARIRNYRVNVATGAAVELAPIDPAFRESRGRGRVDHVTFLPGNGGLIAQVNTESLGEDTPRYRLVRYTAAGRMLSVRPIPAGPAWGMLLG
ncbi:hypothetical protein [Micromonospora siamensis]|uniref:WD40-like Beta Propeller Repeat n=1 Tax=Micromonospora siamensis TaxID=299152 RepID=A0A1C5GWA8_9ACTN|nr:hypothetical protein [Micromonospora siamensis]SCG38040.1 hypothetical protein GA0074704_0611 [Micromonospora siamensis]